ncbi:MAG: protein kinase [Jatrophihabitans sp.]
MHDHLIDDRYRLVDRVGSGEFSSIWSAVDVRLDRTVALKLFAPQATRHLRTEDALSATAARWIPGLTRVYDVLVDLDVGDTQRTAVVRELAPGAALDVWASGGVASSAVATVGAGVATTLAGLHQNGVAHGSVNVPNIIVGPDGEFRLTDFGVRRMLTGVPARPYEDVRQLGAALLSVLTGRHVVGARTARLALHRLRPDSGLRMRQSRAWTHILAGMVSDDVAARPSAVAAAASLTGLVHEPASRAATLRRRPMAEAEKPPWEVIFSG